MKITSLTKPENKKRAVAIDKKWCPITENVYTILSKIPYKELREYELDDKSIQMDEHGTMITFISFAGNKKEVYPKKEEKKIEVSEYSIRQTATIQSNLSAQFLIRNRIEFGKDITNKELIELTSIDSFIKLQRELAEKQLAWIKGEKEVTEIKSDEPNEEESYREIKIKGVEDNE